MTAEANKVWEALREPPGLSNNPDYGDLMSVENFLEHVKSGGFIDYDGYGNWSNGTKCLNDVQVYPSQISKKRIEIPCWATHVVWYNR